MRVGRIAILDSETLEWIYRPLQEYSGPVALAKGGAQAQTNENTANNLSSNYSTQGLGITSSLIPTLQNEVNNPLGFSEQALTEMQTQGGQDAAGAQAAQQRATLAASRTGNLASLPSVQDKLARSATQSADQNALGLDIQNAQLKQRQQQQGIAGLTGIASEDTGAGLNALGLANNANQQVMQAGNWWQPLLGSVISGAEKGAGTYFGGKSCHVAALVFDEDYRTGPTVNLIRSWLHDVYAPSGVLPSLLVSLYDRYSLPAARLISRSGMLTHIARKLFEHILKKARND